MPAATRIKRKHGCAVFLDTHDLQARQYALRNEAGWAVPPTATFESMLEIELAAMREADVLLHLNDEEAASFKVMLPMSRHALLYPAVPPVAAGPGGGDLIIVASANRANFRSVVWFLEEVLPLAPGVEVKIIGNIDGEFRLRAPALLRRLRRAVQGPRRRPRRRLCERRRDPFADHRGPWDFDQDDRGDVVRRALDRDAARLPRHEARPQPPKKRHTRAGCVKLRGGVAPRQFVKARAASRS